jgi:trehalose 6-phosphate phosphatase
MTWMDPASNTRARLALLSSSAQEWALFLDIDGTLLDIAEHPDQVRVPPTLIGDLKRVSESLQGALGLVSGRSIAWIDRAFHPLRFPVAGQQGSEIRLAQDASATIDAVADLGDARRLLRPLVGVDGIEVEDKGLTIAVHYRAAPDRAWAKKAIEQALAALDPAIEAVPGRLVYEVKARGVSKGTGVARLAAAPPFAGRMPVYFGDDHTDEYAFREVISRGGIAVRVGPSQAPPGCLWIESPAETRRWLAGLFARAPEAVGARLSASSVTA